MRFSLLASSLALVACASGAPDDILLLQGAAPAGAEVLLERRLSNVCFYPVNAVVDAEPFEELARTRADGAGEYTFELYRAQTSSGADLRACFRVTRVDDPLIEARAQFFGGDVRVPPLQSWPVVPTPGAGGWTLASLPELPRGSLESGAMYEWQLDVAGRPLWRADASQPLSPAAQVFEDFSAATLHALAQGKFLHYDDSLGLLFATYTEGSLLLRTQKVDLVAPGVALPLTRGAACWLNGVETSPCPATDGALDRAALSSAEAPPTRSLEFRFAEPRVLESLILRGFEESAPSIRVEVAEGEGDWVLVTELFAPDYNEVDFASLMLRTPGRWEIVPLGGVRADRLRLVTDGGIYQVREVSVFE